MAQWLEAAAEPDDIPLLPLAWTAAQPGQPTVLLDRLTFEFIKTNIGELFPRFLLLCM